MINVKKYFGFIAIVLLATFSFYSCKTKKQIPKQQTEQVDTLSKCRLPFKTSKTLSRHIKENELSYTWINAKAEVQTTIDGEEHNLDVRIKGRKDSAIWISIQAIGLLEIAKLLITRDTVIMVVYIKKEYFKGDFNYINKLLNSDLDFDMLQAVLFGNSADFDEDDARMKPVVDKENCHYLLSTVRKRKLRRLNTGLDSLERSLQIITLNPESYKIINNKFEDVSTNRSFHANYSKFHEKDSVFAPHTVDIEIKAGKKIDLKINYVRIELNQPQKLTLTIPKKYEQIIINKE